MSKCEYACITKGSSIISVRLSDGSLAGFPVNFFSKDIDKPLEEAIKWTKQRAKDYEIIQGD
jgi:hypothetical protein